MMPKRRSSNFFIPTYPSSTIFHFSLSPAAVHRNIAPTSFRHPSKLHTSRRGYATHPHSSNINGSNGPTGSIPIGKIHLGGTKVPPPPPRKGIVIKDDLSKSWKELSFPQKVVRTGAQTTNFAIIVIGVGVVVYLRSFIIIINIKGVVLYYLTISVFLPTSETAIYSKAFERVRNYPQVLPPLLGYLNKR